MTVSEVSGFSSLQAPAKASAIGLYARPSVDFAAKLDATIELLRAAAQDHRGTIVQATSLGAEDMVVTDLIARLHLGIAIGTLETGKLLRELKLDKPGRAFYALRHTFRTVADATLDFPAVRWVMGHADDSIDDVYREMIDDARLVAVAQSVRGWLFGQPTDGGQAKPEEQPLPITKRPRAKADGEQPRLRLFAG